MYKGSYFDYIIDRHIELKEEEKQKYMYLTVLANLMEDRGKKWKKKTKN